MKKFNYIFLLLFLCNISFAQQVKFRKVIGSDGYDYGMSAKQTTDKGYIIGGSTSSFGFGNNDMYLVKTDSFGNPYKHVTFGGINIDRGNCVRQTADKGYILCGYTNSFGAGGYDVYLVKTDSNMTEQWEKTYGGADWDFGNCVEQTTDHGYIICGSTYSYGKGNEDYYLIKTDSIGDTLWTKTYGDTLDDYAKSVIQTSDGGYILTGTTKSMGDTLGDFYTIKTFANGDTMWTNKFGGPLLDYGNDVLESMYGGYMVAGETQNYGLGSLGDSDGIIIKLNNSGHVDSTIVTGVPLSDDIESITEDTAGRVAMVGTALYFSNGDATIFIVKKNWRYYYGTNFGSFDYEIGYSIEPTADGGFILCGITNSFNNNLPDIYLIKATELADSASFYNTHDSIFVTSIQNNISTTNTIFKTYPNPANSNVFVFAEQTNENIIVKIFDILGNEIKGELINRNQKTPFGINVSDLSDGIYIINLSSEGKSITQKLVIQH